VLAPLREGLAAMQSVCRWFYVVGGLMWVGALVFAGIRVYQICTQVLVPAVVVDSRLIAYSQPSQETDSDGFTRDSAALSHYREATVRYEANGKTNTAAIGQSGSGFRWIEDRLMKEWKPGAHIRVRIDPARPGKPQPALGLHYSTFEAGIGLLLGGFCFAGFAWGIERALEFVLRKLETFAGR
jgi:hypothetical protein